MSTQLKSNRNYSLEEYFDLEATSQLKYEYLGGAIYAMVGGSVNHNLIAGNLAAQLKLALRDSGCVVFGSDMRVHTRDGLYTYPDVSVVCGKIELTDDKLDTLVNPILLAEVLSKSTAKYDRSEKFEMYQTIDSLREYVLIEQKEIYTERFIKDERGAWQLAATYRSAADAARFSSLSIDVSLVETYRDVKF